MRKLVALSTILVLALTACGNLADSKQAKTEKISLATNEAAGSAQDQQDQNGTEQSKSTKQDLHQEQLAISPDQAAAKAKQVSGGGELTGISLDKENKRPNQHVYEVKTRNGDKQWDIDIDAKSGNVLKQKSEHEAGSPAAVNPSAPMTPERAIELALTVHAGKIASWSLDSDDGRTEYHIEFTDDTEVIVDVATGTARIDD